MGIMADLPCQRCKQIVEGKYDERKEVCFNDLPVSYYTRLGIVNYNKSWGKVCNDCYLLWVTSLNDTKWIKAHDYLLVKDGLDSRLRHDYPRLIREKMLIRKQFRILGKSLYKHIINFLKNEKPENPILLNEEEEDSSVKRFRLLDLD
jgi:hypothetical protein